MACYRVCDEWNTCKSFNLQCYFKSLVYIYVPHDSSFNGSCNVYGKAIVTHYIPEFKMKMILSIIKSRR